MILTRPLQILKIRLPPPCELDQFGLVVAPLDGVREETSSFDEEPEEAGEEALGPRGLDWCEGEGMRLAKLRSVSPPVGRWDVGRLRIGTVNQWHGEVKA